MFDDLLLVAAVVFYGGIGLIYVVCWIGGLASCVIDDWASRRTDKDRQ